MKINKMKNVFFVCYLIMMQNSKANYIADTKLIRDSTIVGHIIAMDSIFQNPNYLYSGIKYYYGVFHIKVALMDITDSNKVTDTLILAYVYNKLTESQQYKNCFDLNLQDYYIFYFYPFRPCQSDFPKIQGTCSENGKYFYPESNKLIKNNIFVICQIMKW